MCKGEITVIDVDKRVWWLVLGNEVYVAQG